MTWNSFFQAVKDQHMFAASTIRRAIEMKAPFLQCIKYFHTISCSDLLTFLPPDSHSDFDAHLVQSIQGLKDLKKDLSAGNGSLTYELRLKKTGLLGF